jgi:ubiquinone/menaquinone biosynthesis C-methylase UbiE
MKVRDSGMPGKDMWENFFNPDEVLITLGLNSKINNAAEFGCGYGTFTIPAAKIIKGEIFALDIEPDMIEITQKRAKKQELNNVKTILRDFVTDGSGLKDENVDFVMLFNILHADNPDKLLREAYRILKLNGTLGIIHWNYDPKTPRGPAMEIRPKPEQCIEWAEDTGFYNPKKYNVGPYHYGIVLIKGRGEL